jgi:hypothetical protein
VAPSKVKLLMTVRITTPRPELADGVAHVLVIAAEAVNPAHYEGIAGPEFVEEAATFRAFDQPRGDPRYPVVSEHLVDGEACGLGLGKLVLNGLLRSRNAGIQDRAHGHPIVR